MAVSICRIPDSWVTMALAVLQFIYCQNLFESCLAGNERRLTSKAYVSGHSYLGGCPPTTVQPGILDGCRRTSSISIFSPWSAIVVG
eukprot:scaffold24312_cov16-Prasinocladus_malaysianus.AAC.2